MFPGVVLQDDRGKREFYALRNSLQGDEKYLGGRRAGRSASREIPAAGRSPQNSETLAKVHKTGKKARTAMVSFWEGLQRQQVLETDIGFCGQFLRARVAGRGAADISAEAGYAKLEKSCSAMAQDLSAGRGSSHSPPGLSTRSAAPRQMNIDHRGRLTEFHRWDDAIAFDRWCARN